MENIEEATVESNGDVTIRYYYGKEIRIPAIIVKGEFIKALKEELRYIVRLDRTYCDWQRGREQTLRYILGILGEDLDEDIK